MNQYTIRVKEGRRDALQQALSSAGIGSAIYYPVPLHLQGCFAALGHQEGDLPHTELAANEVLSLPMFPEMTTAEQDRVIDTVSEFCQSGTTTTSVSVPMSTPSTGANVDLPTSKAG